MEHAIQSLKRETSDKQTQACKRIDELQQKITTLQHTLEETTSTHRLKLMVCVCKYLLQLTTSSEIQPSSLLCCEEFERHSSFIRSLSLV